MVVVVVVVTLTLPISNKYVYRKCLPETKLTLHTSKK